MRLLVSSEELLLELTPLLRQFDRAAMNLQLPDHGCRDLFDETVTVVDVLSPASTKSIHDQLSIAAQSWLMTEQRPQPRANLKLLRPLFENVNYLERANFYFVRGTVNEGFTEFDSQLGVAALCRDREGAIVSIQGTIDVVWQRSADAPPGAESWRIKSWLMRHLQTMHSTQHLFAEFPRSVFPDPGTRQRTVVSQHNRLLQRHYYRGREATADREREDTRFFPIATAFHPGISVVDINRDGWDDLYVSVRWGKNMLLVNQQDGTFAEQAADFGLDIDGRTNSAIFADFDNDGDIDAMLARGTERSIYLVNEEGRFVDRSSDLVDAPLPYEATSLSAADFNGDGLLDVYFCTYHQDDIQNRIDADLSHPDHRIHTYLSPEDSAELRRRHRNENRSFLSHVGPPNVLLVNQGNGRFGRAAQQDEAALWRNSFQATWADYDNDGDPDLYVANDFSADFLLRNDGEQGFTDVTDQGVATLGFGMGASWGDIDQDGNQDLYVSNMASKAGVRITASIDGVDPNIALLASGNYLYRQHEGRFQLVPSTSKKMPVAKAGWAWGGQFADFDNDGHLDIYVPHGYNTPPDEFASEDDL